MSQNQPRKPNRFAHAKPTRSAVSKSDSGPKRPTGRPVKRGGPDPARRVAFDVLAAVTARDAYANLILPSLLRERGLTGRDAAFATELSYGTLRTLGTLDAVLTACSDRSANETDPRVREALRLGAYQLLYTRVPPHAAVGETVALAKVALTDGPARFVNAILRQVSQRDLPAWLAALAPERDTDPVGYLALHHAHPEWIVRALSEALRDRDPMLAETERALVANNTRPEVHLAARPGGIDRNELADQANGKPGEFSPFAVRLTSGGDPGRLVAIQNGLAGVQDEGSQLVALALANVPLEGSDARWLDMCAGPGGKAALLGGIAGGRNSQVTAVEVGEKRAELVRQATQNMPVSVLHTDARLVGKNPKLPAESFDRVMLDAPCTGLGALRRRPEARWRRQPADIPELTKLQRELLSAAVRAVRPGGLIGYMTCSPHLAETKVQIADVVRRYGLIQLDAGKYLPGVPALDEGPTVQLWPHRHGTDAMFLSLLQRP